MAALAVPLVVGIGGALIGAAAGKLFGPKPVTPPNLLQQAPAPTVPQLAPIEAKAQAAPEPIAEQRQARRVAQESKLTAIEGMDNSITAGVKVKTLLGE